MPSLSRYSDPAMNTFKKTNMYYETDPFIKYQDPTYIGFKLLFLFDQPGSGLLSEKPLKNTAMGYLEKIGDTIRMGYLKSFVKLLKRINEETPWFFQTIEGLDEAWKHMYQEKDYKPILTDRKVIINCLDESVDLRMTALMDLYRKACFDWPNRREVVPANLRRFTVRVYCYEGRFLNRWGFPWSPSALGINGAIEAAIPSFLKYGKRQMDRYFGPDEKSDLKGFTGEGSVGDKLKNVATEMFGRKKDSINPHISRVMYLFNYCEWLPDESNALVASISHKDWGLKAQKIAFSYQNVEEDNIFRFHHDQRVQDTIIGTLDNLALDNPSFLEKDGVPPIVGAYAAGAISRGVTELRDLLVGKLNDLLLGNVYGFQPLLAAQSLANGGVSGALSLVKEAGKNTSKDNATNDVVNGKAGENPYSDIQANPSGISSNVSKNNLNGSNPSTPQGINSQDASLANDKGSDSTSQGLGQSNASLTNQNGSNPSKPQGLSPFNASLSNDKNSNPATSQGSPTMNVSLSNDNGADAPPLAPPFGNLGRYFDNFSAPSLQNDNNPKKGQETSPLSMDSSIKIPDNVYKDSSSFGNDNGPDSKSQGLGPENASLSNMTGSNPSKPQTLGQENASLANDNGSDAKSQGLGPDSPSLSNDNGPDAKSQGSPNGNASLGNS